VSVQKEYRMLSSVFELQVQRGLAYLTPDMRTIESRVRVSRPASETWRLRCDFDLERHIAGLNRRRLNLVEENTAEQDTPNEQTQRIVRCELEGEHLGGITMGAITSKDLVSEISSTFFKHRFDEDHGATFAVEFVKVVLNVHISGHQWCEPETESSCFLCTHVKVSVKVPGVGSLIERQLERQMRASHAAFPHLADAYVKQQQEQVAATRGALTTPSPTSSPDLNRSKPPEQRAPVALPGSVERTSGAPQLSRWQLAWSLLVGWAFGGLRRHRFLQTDGPGGTVVVRVSPRSARLLLLCGCASAEQDEIVE